jgi:hypothetical protein
MKLDRNGPRGNMGKYAAINVRRIKTLSPQEREEATDLMARLDAMGIVESGQRDGPNEFFLIKLKDKFAVPALDAYAQAVVSAAYDCSDDVPPDEGLLEYFRDVNELVERAANHPLKKQPD